MIRYPPSLHISILQTHSIALLDTPLCSHGFPILCLAQFSLSHTEYVHTLNSYNAPSAAFYRVGHVHA